MNLNRVSGIALIILGGLVGTATGAQHAEENGHAHGHEHSSPGHRHVPKQPEDHNAYMSMLEREGRDAYQKPAEVLEAMGLWEGVHVADIGAGSGYFTRRIAAHIGPRGKIYALDIEQPFLDRIRQDARQLGLNNIEIVLTSPERPDLPSDSVDIALIVNTWHHIPNPKSYAKEVHRILKPNGRFIHIDWKKMETPEGPPLNHRLSRQELLKEMAASGFKLRSEHHFLPWHYYLVFEPAED